VASAAPPRGMVLGELLEPTLGAFVRESKRK
jgi:hypothetical protein